VAELKKDRLAKPGHEGDLRAELFHYFRAQLAQRTPDLIARAVEFRTGRQALASDLDTSTVARAFFVDLVQATFAATYRTGGWPRRFRSFVGRELAVRIARRCLSEDEKPTDALANKLLDLALRWDDDRVAFEEVTAEVNGIVGEAEDFGAVTMEELLRAEEEAGGDDDD